MAVVCRPLLIYILEVEARVLALDAAQVVSAISTESICSIVITGLENDTTESCREVRCRQERGGLHTAIICQQSC